MVISILRNSIGLKYEIYLYICMTYSEMSVNGKFLQS